MMKEQWICDRCRRMLADDTITGFDDLLLCNHCREDLTVVCRDCGRRIRRLDANDTDLCDDCYYSNYTTCTDCGEIINYDDVYYEECDEDTHDRPYCTSCYNTHRDKAIHDYYYKPDPIFFGKGCMYMGVELEVDDGGEDEEFAERLLSVANANDDCLYIKHDGSLDNGFELVTHPMTMEYHRQHMPWKDILKEAIRLRYYSHKAETCGLHIHVSKTSLGTSGEDRENTIARIVYFYEKFWPEMLRFSRRTEYQVNRWATRYGGVLSTCKNSLETAKKAGLGRYTAVNLNNENTIEFRIFRGTLKYDTFMATLEFTYYLCCLAKRYDDEQFHSMSWLDFVSGIDKDEYPELVTYLKQRRLYVNEPVEETEEI